VSRPGTIVDAHGEPFLIRADKDAAWSKGTILRQPVIRQGKTGLLFLS
jgi:hypothetical protein